MHSNVDGRDRNALNAAMHQWRREAPPSKYAPAMHGDERLCNAESLHDGSAGIDLQIKQYCTCKTYTSKR